MNTSHLFDEPIEGLVGLTDFTNRWQTVLDSFRDRNYRDTIINFLHYLDPGVVSRCGNTELTEFSIPHGSTIMNISIDSTVRINAPFLSIPEKRVNALLRQITEINFSVLFLSRIVLEDGKLFFKAEFPLELCEPYRLYDIFWEICMNADHYDDVFIEKFQAQRICAPRVEKYSEVELQGFHAGFLRHVNEGLEYLRYFRDNRWYDMGVESGLISLMKINYIFSPKGHLSYEIGNAIGASYGKNPAAERLDCQCTFFEKLCTIALGKFAESIYKTESLIAVRKHAFLPGIKTELENYWTNAEKDISSSAFMSAAIFLLYDIYSVYNRFRIPRTLEEMLNTGLRAASGRDWQTAAQELYKAVSSVMQLQQPSE